MNLQIKLEFLSSIGYQQTLLFYLLKLLNCLKADSLSFLFRSMEEKLHMIKIVQIRAVVAPF